MKFADYLRDRPQTPINRHIKKLEDSENHLRRTRINAARKIILRKGGDIYDD